MHHNDGNLLCFICNYYAEIWYRVAIDKESLAKGSNHHAINSKGIFADGNHMRYLLALKHFDSKLIGGPLREKWIDHAYNTLGGLFELRASPVWDVKTTLINDYVAVEIHGDGHFEDALKMVASVIEEQNKLIKGLSLQLHKVDND